MKVLMVHIQLWYSSRRADEEQRIRVKMQTVSSLRGSSRVSMALDLQQALQSMTAEIYGSVLDVW